MTEPIQFEKSLLELEDIVKKLEQGDLPLEDALKFYEKGIHLARKCQSDLTQAEQKIEILRLNSLDTTGLCDD